MEPVFSRHASHRAQQRGVPPLISNWLIDYGEEVFDGRGGVVRYFTRDSIRRMERDFGREPVKRLSEFLRCYLVMSANDGTVVTVGKRHQNKRLASRAH
jgi:predicted SnoaL-like aldol condensation-catalyzing enzyme